VIGVAYLVSELGGTLLEIALSLSGIFGGPNLATFSLGFLFSFTNSYVSSDFLQYVCYC